MLVGLQVDQGTSGPAGDFTIIDSDEYLVSRFLSNRIINVMIYFIVN